MLTRLSAYRSVGIKTMKFLPITHDIRHWGVLRTKPYHTLEPQVLGWAVVEAWVGFHHVPHWHL
jgi:hypothetical protein